MLIPIIGLGGALLVGGYLYARRREGATGVPAPLLPAHITVPASQALQTVGAVAGAITPPIVLKPAVNPRKPFALYNARERELTASLAAARAAAASKAKAAMARAADLKRLAALKAQAISIRPTRPRPITGGWGRPRPYISPSRLTGAAAGKPVLADFKHYEGKKTTPKIALMHALQRWESKQKAATTIRPTRPSPSWDPAAARARARARRARDLKRLANLRAAASRIRPTRPPPGVQISPPRIVIKKQRPSPIKPRISTNSWGRPRPYIRPRPRPSVLFRPRPRVSLSRRPGGYGK